MINEKILSKDLQNVVTLNLSYCGITELNHDVFVNLINLQHLYLNGNPLTTLPKALNTLSNLLSLDISALNVTTLNEDNSMSLPKLNTLKMTNMKKLISIEFCAFCGSSNLKEIDLSNNYHLKKIDSNAFGYSEYNKNSMIQIFDIRNCNLTYLPKNLLNWKNVKKIFIGDNPFICDFKMEWLLLDFYRKEAKYGHIQEYPIADDGNFLFCNGPEPFENKNFYQTAKAMYYKDPVIQAQTSALINPFSNQNFINSSLFGIFIFAVILLFILILLILCCRRMRRQKRVEECVDEVEKLYFEA